MFYDDDDDIIDFEGFDNENGLKVLIVPNIVHLLYLQETNIKFFQLINIFSIYFNHKPNEIMIHCDNCSFSGKYWDIIKSTHDLWKIIKIHKVPFKETIFDVPFGWTIHHRYIK